MLSKPYMENDWRWSWLFTAQAAGFLLTVAMVCHREDFGAATQGHAGYVYSSHKHDIGADCRLYRFAHTR
jgi:hypothetical protein